jgi:hypothetical protein
MTPSKKAIKATVDKLLDRSYGPAQAPRQKVGKPAPAKSNQRIRKQGI